MKSSISCWSLSECIPELSETSATESKFSLFKDRQVDTLDTVLYNLLTCITFANNENKTYYTQLRAVSRLT